MSTFLKNIARRGAGLPPEAPPPSLNAGLALQHGGALDIERDVPADGPAARARAGEFDGAETGLSRARHMPAPEAATPAPAGRPSSESAAEPEGRNRRDAPLGDERESRPRPRRRGPAAGEEGEAPRATARGAGSFSTAQVYAAPSPPARPARSAHEPAAAHAPPGPQGPGAVSESAATRERAAPERPNPSTAGRDAATRHDARVETAEGSPRPARAKAATPAEKDVPPAGPDGRRLLQPQATPEPGSMLPAAQAGDEESRTPRIHVRIGSVEVRAEAPPAPRPPERPRGLGGYSPARRYLDRRWY